MFLNLFNKKNSTKLTDYSSLAIDLHSHLIPGIDDGAQTVEESLQLIRDLKILGFRKLITTPHIMQDHYPNTPAIISEGLNKLRTAIEQEHIDMEIEAAAEYYCDQHFESLLEQGNLLTIGNNLILFELPFVNEPANVKSLLFKMQTKGFKPLLAHPERYPYYSSDFARYEELKNAGCLFLLSINSLSGYYGKEEKRTAERLVDNGFVDFLAGDVHRMNHIEQLKKSLRQKYIRSLLTTYPLKNRTLL